MGVRSSRVPVIITGPSLCGSTSGGGWLVPVVGGLLELLGLGWDVSGPISVVGGDGGGVRGPLRSGLPVGLNGLELVGLFFGLLLLLDVLGGTVEEEIGHDVPGGGTRKGAA